MPPFLPWIALLWAAAALFYSPVLFGGRSFYFRDSLAVYYPQAGITAEAIRSGALPLWEPSIGLGYPFQSDPHSMLFYPLSLLLAALPFPRGYDIFTVLHVPLAGTFLFLLLARWRLSFASCALGAAALMFCGFTTTTTCLTTLLRGITWAAAALLAFDGFLENGRWLSLCATVLALALGGSCTDPQYVLFALMLLAALAWLRPGPPVPIRRAWGGLAAAACLAGCVLAYQYLPLAELLAWSDRAEGLVASEHGHFAIHPRDGYNFLFPLLFTDLESNDFYANYVSGRPPLVTDVYWGLPLLSIAAAAFAWVFGERDRLSRPALLWPAIALFAVLVSLGGHTPLYPAMLAVVKPLAAFRYPSKYLLIAAIAVAVSAALGFEALLSGRERSRAVARSALGVSLAVVVLASFVLLASGDAPPRLFVTGPIESGATLRDAWLANLGFMAVVLAVLLALAARATASASSVLAAGLLIAIDLMAATWGSYFHIEDQFLLDRPAALAWMQPAPEGQPAARFVSHAPRTFQDGPGRTVANYMLLRRELITGLRGSLLGLNPLLGFMSVRLANQALFHGLIEYQSDATLQDRLAGAAGARYVLSLETPGPPSTAARTVGRIGPMLCQELDPAIVNPRAFIAATARPAEAGARLPSVGSLLALPGEAVFAGTAALTPVAVRHCRIVAYDRHRVEIHFELEGAGLLVLLDIFYPGWKAEVDGKERAIAEVAGLFRGVEVRQGEKKLVFTYRPAAFRLGAAISAGGLLLLAAGFVPAIRRRLAG